MNKKSDIPELTITPRHMLKPKLEWVGRLLGMDLYIDLSQQRQPNEKRMLAQEILKKALEAPEETK